MGIVKAVCISEKKGTQKVNIHSARFIENYGIEHDAHAGNWHRQVSLISKERIDAFKERGAQVEDGAFGENLIVEGYDFKTLPVGTCLLYTSPETPVTESPIQIEEKRGDRNMKIFNTLTRKKEEFVPLEPGKVKMYVCGPTVYNFIHIGNARPMIVFDTVRRYFEYKGYDVNYVSNFTDVDDKIIKKAIEEGVDADTISQRYIEECKKDMAGMNVKPATTHPQATQEICGMLEMIQTLIDSGHAYKAADGTVYFRTCLLYTSRAGTSGPARTMTAT